MSFGLGFGFPGTASSGGATLALQFAGATALDPRITFTRASSATYFNADGVLTSATNDTPRLDYNPTTLAAQGLLIEEQRTNLLTYSEQFDNAAWFKSNATVNANVVASPTGNLNATLVTDTTSSTEHYVSENCPTTTNQTYTQSIYVKAGTALSFILSVIAVGSSNAVSSITFTQTSGVFVAGAIAGLVTEAKVIAAKDGWYRCLVTYTLNGTVTAHQMRLYPHLGGIYVGTGLGTYFYGAQLEAGAFATSYIPTVAAQATRAAESAVMTGTNFSSWYNQTEGTLYAEAAGFSSSTYRPVAQFDDGATNNRLYIDSDFGPIRAVSTVAGVNQCLITLGSMSVNTTFKVGAAFKLNDCAASLNGGAIGTDTTALMPTVNRLRIGTDGGNFWNGYLRLITYYPRRLSNAELQAITT